MAERKLFVTLKVMSTPPGIAPLGDDVTVAEDNPGRTAAIFERADRFAERLAAEGLVMRELEVLRRFGFVGDGEIYRLLKFRPVKTSLLRRPPLPITR